MSISTSVSKVAQVNGIQLLIRSSERAPRSSLLGKNRQKCVRIHSLAEGEGFEPPKACTLVVFKTTAIDHSAIPPAIINDTCA